MILDRTLAVILLAGGLTLSFVTLAADPVPTGPAPRSAVAPCLSGQTPGPRLAQGQPLDCCKGHKGICGCRAGKIVCCDGTVSKDPNCTCHADSGLEL